MRTWKTAIAAGAIAMCGITSASAQDKEITLCWAAWDPANALVELSKDFTAKSGIKMKFEFVPWTNFADRMLNELNSGGKLCDLMIGDSQWIGGGATYGHYVKLNDFFDKEGISMDDFAPATVYAYSTWPKGTPNYYALPAMGDAVGWVYRKDWFSRPELQAEFKKKYGHDLAVPKSWTELKEIAEFFQGREIDGKKVYGAAIYTERGSEGITMGVLDALFPWGFKFENTPGKYDMEGAVNSPQAVEALEFYKSLYECCTPPGHSDAYMTEDLDVYKSGQTALQMNFFAFFPGVAKDPNVGGDVSGFFASPPQKQPGSMLGGQGISVVSYSDKKDEALQYIKWFAQPDVQAKWWQLGGFSCHKKVLEAPGFATSTPFAGEFLKAMASVQDFWQEPTYAELLQAMQKRVLNSSDIWGYLQVTAHFVVWTMLIQVVLGLGLALLINRNFKTASFWTTVILVPMMLSPAVVGTFWTYLFQPQTGIFSYIVGFFAGTGAIDMIGSIHLAPWAIVIVDTWMWTPYIMLLCLAGLRSIPDYLYEAAEIDRANALQKFWYITLPRVLPFLMLAVLFRGIENFKMFDMVVELTSGGPGSATELASINLKREAFEAWKTGYSSAFAVILFVTVFGLGNIYVKALNRVKS